MADQYVIGVEVIEPGEGYAVKPEIIIGGSSITATVDSSAFSIFFNNIAIIGHSFVTGDCVRYTVGDNTVAPTGLTDGAYYYVRKLNPNLIALYETYEAATYTDKLPAYNPALVQFIDAGSGSNNIFAVTARAVLFDNSQPTREISVDLKFDRVSYTTDIVDWVSGDTYIANESRVIYNNNLYLCLVTNSDTSFVTPGFYVPTYEISSIVRNLNSVTVETTTAHGLTTGDHVNISGTNDFDGIYGPITVINSTTFMYVNIKPNASDVKGTVRKADTWEKLYSGDPRLTAADRVRAFYHPTLSRPGNVLSQVMSGIDYPNAIFDGTSFTAPPSTVIDTNLISPTFTQLDPTTYDVVGGLFLDGYGPEELVPGVVYDTLTMQVTSDYSGTPLNFSIFVDRAGTTVTYNTNPYTQTQLAQNFVSTGSYNDVIHLVNASVINGPNPYGLTYGFIYLNGEYIRYDSIDLVHNTITGLSRGIFGTIVNNFVASGSTVQSILNRDQLDPQLYNNQWWYGPPGSPSANTTLEVNTYPAAVFLQKLVP